MAFSSFFFCCCNSMQVVGISSLLLIILFPHSNAFGLSNAVANFTVKCWLLCKITSLSLRKGLEWLKLSVPRAWAFYFAHFNEFIWNYSTMLHNELIAMSRILSKWSLKSLKMIFIVLLCVEHFYVPLTTWSIALLTARATEISKREIVDDEALCAWIEDMREFSIPKR